MPFARILTFAPAAGLLGLALHQAVNLHDGSAAVQSVLQAAAILGFGRVVHSTNAAVK